MVTRAGCAAALFSLRYACGICCGALQRASTSAEALTDVGAAISVKEIRPHWEVCLEGKQVWDQWDAEFEAMVQCNDKEAADYCYGLSKKQKDQEHAWILGEHRNMKRGDRESKPYMSIDDTHEQLRSYRQQELRVEVPPAALVGALDEGRPRDPLVLQPQEPPRVVQRGNHQLLPLRRHQIRGPDDAGSSLPCLLMERPARDDPRALLDEAQGGLVGEPFCSACAPRQWREGTRFVRAFQHSRIIQRPSGE